MFATAGFLYLVINLGIAGLGAMLERRTRWGRA